MPRSCSYSWLGSSLPSANLVLIEPPPPQQLAFSPPSFLRKPQAAIFRAPPRTALRLRIPLGSELLVVSFKFGQNP